MMSGDDANLMGREADFSICRYQNKKGKSLHRVEGIRYKYQGERTKCNYYERGTLVIVVSGVYVDLGRREADDSIHW